MKSLVSVIIPTYNYAKFLPEAIDSVLNQTYQDVEIIIVDDGSTDNTKEIVGNYIQKYPNKVRYLYQKNQGPGAASNKGIIESKGEFIAILGADDIWLPEKLKMQMDLFEEFPVLGFVHTDYSLFNEKRQMLNFKFGVKSKNFSGYIFKYLLRECFIRTSTAIVKRECLNNVGLFEEILSEDYDFWLRVSRKYKAGYIDKVLAMCREHPKQLHRLDFHKSYLTVQKVIEKTVQTFPEIKNDSECKISLKYREAKIHFELGYHLFAQNKLTQAREEFKISLEHKFITLTFIYYLLTFMGSFLLSLCRKAKRQLERALIGSSSLIIERSNNA